MARHRGHSERHASSRIGWLRAAVLGANDGIVSTASLIIGVAAASADKGQIMLAGAAGLVAGAMSMAAGEYVSVSSQADSEAADLSKEKRELAELPEQELAELTHIYVSRGLDPELAKAVAEQLTAKDALGAHARDELGITDFSTARPVQAAFASAASFAVGAALPMLAVVLTPTNLLAPVVFAASIIFLAALGLTGSKVGGASAAKPVGRVVVWGALAMIITYAIGRLVGAVV